jgi:hypothetical protein
MRHFLASRLASIRKSVSAPGGASAKRPRCSSTSIAQPQLAAANETLNRRNKVHLAFVAAQPCLVCRRSPCDAHHLKFAQPRTLGRKVSDEFTVPLCREHHRDLHRHGNEVAWWANVQIAPIEAAKELWHATLIDSDVSIPRKGPPQPDDQAMRVPE